MRERERGGDLLKRLTLWDFDLCCVVLDLSHVISKLRDEGSGVRWWGREREEGE